MENRKEGIRFSVIIPAYNIEEYIEKCIKSVKNQTYKNYETIVIDDYSSDNTAKKIEKQEGIIFIQHKENMGLGGARNTGMNRAKGEYIIFLDGDDYLNNDDVLEKLDKLIGNNTPDVVYMGFEMIGKKTGTIIPTEETCTKSYRIAGDHYANAWSKCWNRKFLLDNKLYFPEKRYYEDVVFIYNAITKVENYLIADFPVHTYYSGRANSITTSVKFKNIYDTIANIEELVEIRKQKDTPEINKKINQEIIRCKERLEEIVYGKD